MMNPIPKQLTAALLAGFVYSVVAYLTSGVVPKEYHGAALVCWGVHLWTVCLALAAARRPPLVQAYVVTGLSWGFLIGLSIAISVQNWRVSVNWPTFLPALVVVPLVAWLTGLPVYGISTLIERRRKTQQAPCSQPPTVGG